LNKSVDQFLKDLILWPEEANKLRAILLKTELQENFKWGLPCYSYDEKNIVIIQPFKSCLALMFFKGSLLKDVKKLLASNGPNSQAGRRFEFRSVKEIKELEAEIKAYIKEAIVLEESGEKVKFKKNPQPMPIELKKILSQNSKLKKAFESQTPGRQRAYILHFSGAKQAETRIARIEKCMARILAGKGLADR
jgi:uncharacterized protein YdeI (YjbR/CyaY-like superfamily)